MSAARRRADGQAVVLLLTGGTVARIAITGELARYVRISLRPYLLAAAVAVITVAAVTLARRGRCGRPAAEPAAEDHGHGHGHRRAEVGWLLAVPMAALLLVGPPALGTFAASRGGSAVRPPAGGPYPSLPPGDPLAMSLADFATRADFDPSGALRGRRVTLTGFLVRAPDGGWLLTRMVITCCAADAQPIKAGLDGMLPAGVAAGTWVTVTGELDGRGVRDPINDARIPYLRVAAAAVVPEPADPYES